MPNVLPSLNLDFGGLELSDNDGAPDSFGRLKGDEPMPVGTPEEVQRMFNDGGDPAFTAPPVHSEKDVNQLRQTPDPQDPLSEPSAPHSAWARNSGGWATNVGATQDKYWSPDVPSEMRKRMASRRDPSFLDRFLPYSWSEFGPADQEAVIAKRRATLGTAEALDRMIKENPPQQREGGSDPYDTLTRPNPMFQPEDQVAGPAGAAAIEALKQATGSKPTMPAWRDFTENTVREFLGGLVFSTAKLPGYAVETPRLLGAWLRGNPNLDENAYLQAVTKVQQEFERAFPGDPGRANEFLSQLSSGLGSMASFYVGGGVMKALGAPMTLGTVITGAATGADQQYRDAMRYGASPAARLISIYIGAGLGATDAIPIDRALSFMNRASGGGAVTKILMASVSNGIEEMTQEMGQQLGQNLLAKTLYDNSRDIFAGVKDAGAVAFVLGMFFGGGTAFTQALTQSIANRMDLPPPNLTPQQAPPAGQGEGTPGTESPSTGEKTIATGKLNDMAGPLAGTGVQVVEQTPDGSSYLVRFPDGRTTYTGVRTIDALTPTPEVVAEQQKAAEETAKATDPEVSAIRSPESLPAPYAQERTRPPVGIAESAPGTKPTPSSTEINTRFKDAIGLMVKRGRFDRGHSKADAIYKWGQSVARVKNDGQMTALFHEGGHHVHQMLGSTLNSTIKQHEKEIFHIADSYYGGGGQLKLSDTVGRAREGFAHFFQVWMNNPAEANVIAPKFSRAFDELMQKEMPEIKTELEAIRQDVDAWLSKPSKELARDRVISNKKLGTVGKIAESINGGTVFHDIATLSNQVYTRLMNDQHPITQAVRHLKEIAENNFRVLIERGEISKADAKAKLEALDRRGRLNPVKMAALARNSYNASSQMIADGVAKYGRENEAAASKGIAQILSAVMGGKRLDQTLYQDFNTYLAMRRVVSEWQNYYATLVWDRAKNFGSAVKPASEPPVKRFRRPDTISLGDAQQAIADIEKANKHFAQAAKDTYDYLDALLQYKVDAGLTTMEQATQARLLKDYVPLRREMDGSKSGSLGKSKDAATGKDNLLRAFRGSDRRILSPIESIMQMTHETVALVAKNDVKRAFTRMALDVGQGSGAIVEKIPASTMKGTSVKLSDVVKAAGDFSLADEVAQAMGRDEITMQEFMDEVLDGDEVGTIWRKADISEKGEPIVYTWNNGELEAYSLNDPDFADELYRALTELGKEQTNLLINILGKPAAVLRAGVTSSPPFMIANLVRDQLSAWVLNDGVYPGVALGKGIASDLMDRKARRMYNLSMASIGGSNIAALDKTRFGSEQTMLAKAGIGITTEQTLAGALRLIESSETWGRQGIWQTAYKKALADGLNPADAMIEAGFEATDFANYGRVGSKMIATRRLVTFLNANLQGLDKTLRTALGGEGSAAFLRKELAPWIRRQISPAMANRFGLAGSETSLPLTQAEKMALARAGRTLTKMMILALASAALSMLYWDDDEYQSFSPYMKGTRWMVKIAPGKWLAIPKPFQLATFATMTEYAIDGILKGDPTALQNFMASQLAVIAPPIENPSIKLAYELATNVDTFRDKEIVPSYLQALPAWLQYDEYTSELGKQMGRFTGASPMVVDHVITASFATWGRAFLSASNMLDGSRPKQGLDDLAFTSYFIKDGSRSSTIRPAFYNLVGQTTGKLTGAYQGYKRLMDGGAVGQAQEYLANLSDDQKAFAELYFYKDVAEKRLHPLRNAYDVVTAISGMRKEIMVNRLQEGGEDDSAIITLSPTQQKLINDRLSDLQVRVQRNAMVAVGEPGFAQRKILPTLPLIKQIESIDPRVAKDLKIRLGDKVYSADVVAEQWPRVKALILQRGEKANLKPFVAKAKAAGRQYWTTGD